MSELPNVPIGTIVAYAGGMDDEWLKSQGWLYCNGDSLEKSKFADLYFAVGTNYGGGRSTFNLPDLRGEFVRGTDLASKHDPAAASRTASKPGGMSGDSPGSVQVNMTALPVKPFTADTAGAHKHTVPHAPVGNNAYAIMGGHYGIWRDADTETSKNGAHTHTIASGGDKETRPINKYVYFLIKYADAV